MDFEDRKLEELLLCSTIQITASFELVLHLVGKPKVSTVVDTKVSNFKMLQYQAEAMVHR